MKKISAIVLLLIITSTLLACAGGSGSGTPSDPSAAPEPDANPVVGGYTEERDLTAEDTEIFAAAMEGFDGVRYEPLKVSTQVVAGTNYKFYCKATNATPDAKERYVYVTIYVPLPSSGDSAEITNIQDITK
jgi:hypothetical protein